MSGFATFNEKLIIDSALYVTARSRIFQTYSKPRICSRIRKYFQNCFKLLPNRVTMCLGGLDSRNKKCQNIMTLPLIYSYNIYLHDFIQKYS